MGLSCDNWRKLFYLLMTTKKTRLTNFISDMNDLDMNDSRNLALKLVIKNCYYFYKVKLQI